MSFLKTMDLYKGIVLLSLILLPLGGWWVTKLDDNIAACTKALNDATRPGGLLEQIGSLKQKIVVVVENRGSIAIDNHRNYFEGQIRLANQSLPNTEFDPKAAKEENVNIKGSKQRATDYVVDIAWNKDLKVQMDFVSAVLFNCESAASPLEAAGRPGIAQQSVWRLRNLELINSADTVRGTKVPEPELEDSWSIKDMKFARREPKKGT